MPTVSLKLPDDLHQELESHCRVSGLGKSEVIRRALRGSLGLPAASPPSRVSSTLPEVNDAYATTTTANPPSSVTAGSVFTDSLPFKCQNCGKGFPTSIGRCPVDVGRKVPA